MWGTQVLVQLVKLSMKYVVADSAYAGISAVVGLGGFSTCLRISIDVTKQCQKAICSNIHSRDKTSLNKKNSMILVIYYVKIYS